MATVIEPRDAVEDALLALDQDYLNVYGPDMGTWSKGVRGEFLDTLHARRCVDHETHPVYPRRASAGRRRRRFKQLGFRLRLIAPGAVTVLATPVWTDAQGPMRRVYVVTARSSDGSHIKLPRGGSHRLADLLQSAYPKADWSRPQTWHWDTRRLTTWGEASRAFRDTADAGYVEDLAAYTARTAEGAR